MIYNDVEQKNVTDRPADADPFACNKKMLGAIANHAHCNALASTKRKLSIANATPGPLSALDFEKLAPLSCAVLVPVLNGRLA